jgi:hypothetical protein
MYREAIFFMSLTMIFFHSRNTLKAMKDSLFFWRLLWRHQVASLRRTSYFAIRASISSASMGMEAMRSMLPFSPMR